MNPCQPRNVLLLAIAAVVLCSLPLRAPAQAPSARSKDAQWVFYGLLLSPLKDANTRWDNNSPNFHIDEPKIAAMAVPEHGNRVVCDHAMYLRDACLMVNAGPPGTYEWGTKTGQSLQPGAKVTIVSVQPLPSKKGTYLWVEIKKSS
jgi:hypothetical protein